MTNTRRDHDEAARHILEIQEQMQAVQTQLNEQQRTNAEALGAFQTSFQAFQVEVRQWMRAFTLQGAANPPPASTVQSPARAPAQVMEQGSASMNRPPRAEWMGKGQTKVANNSPGTSSIGSWSVNKGKPMVQLSQAELEKLKEQKLCFYCREKWQHGHKCKPKAFNVITGTEEGEQEQKPTRKSSYCNAVEASSSAEIMDSRVKDLLSQYEDVFSEPQGLPPTRMHDHAIPLVANANPVNLKAYRIRIVGGSMDARSSSTPPTIVTLLLSPTKRHVAGLAGFPRRSKGARTA
nr:phosphate transporter pho1 -like 10 [Ipomoea batatas]